ncbi:hypothetical protein LZ32DRAFT_687338 [Colletotrichum eremochloae]|nr:hypothetical protein LZ32DRAFT_687338 [Colletotrichum eremochloae]
MIVLTHDSQLEERLCDILGVNIFQQDSENVLLWDIQLANELSIRFPIHGTNPRHGRNGGNVAQALGIPVQTLPTPHNPEARLLTHNASMDAAFTLEVCLALCFLTSEQMFTLRSGGNLPLLAPRFGVETVTHNDPHKSAVPRPSKQAVKAAGPTPVVEAIQCGGFGGKGEGKEMELPYPLDIHPHLAKFAPASWQTSDPNRLNIPSEVATEWLRAGFIARYCNTSDFSALATPIGTSDSAPSQPQQSQQSSEKAAAPPSRSQLRPFAEPSEVLPSSGSETSIPPQVRGKTPSSGVTGDRSALSLSPEPADQAHEPLVKWALPNSHGVDKFIREGWNGSEFKGPSDDPYDYMGAEDSEDEDY